MMTEIATIATDETRQVERELAELAQAIARLYDTPTGEAATYLARQREREGLEARLDAARARLLTLHLTQTTEAYVGVTAALGAEQEALVTAERSLQQAQQHANVARGRVEELAARERILREQRQNLRQRLAACALAAGEPNRHVGLLPGATARPVDGVAAGLERRLVS